MFKPQKLDAHFVRIAAPGYLEWVSNLKKASLIDVHSARNALWRSQAQFESLVQSFRIANIIARDPHFLCAMLDILALKQVVRHMQQRDRLASKPPAH